jgi:hypothetical protein
MGLLDAFRKDEVAGSTVLVCALGTQHEELRKNDERIYKCFYPKTTSMVATTNAELQSALKQGSYDVVHLIGDVDAQGAVTDSTGGRLSGDDLLRACVDSGDKLFWFASDNPADSYNAGFKPKGLKLNVMLIERRLGPNFNLFLDNLLTRMSGGESFSKAWSVVSKPEGKSVQPDVPHTIVSAGRGGVVLRP